MTSTGETYLVDSLPMTSTEETHLVGTLSMTSTSETHLVGTLPMTSTGETHLVGTLPMTSIAPARHSSKGFRLDFFTPPSELGTVRLTYIERRSEVRWLARFISLLQSTTNLSVVKSHNVAGIIILRL